MELGDVPKMLSILTVPFQIDLSDEIFDICLWFIRFGLEII